MTFHINLPLPPPHHHPTTTRSYAYRSTTSVSSSNSYAYQHMHPYPPQPPNRPRIKLPFLLPLLVIVIFLGGAIRHTIVVIYSRTSCPRCRSSTSQNHSFDCRNGTKYSTYVSEGYRVLGKGNDEISVFPQTISLSLFCLT